MKASIIQALVFALLGLGTGWLWSKHIIVLVRFLWALIEPLPASQVVAFDGWMT